MTNAEKYLKEGVSAEKFVKAVWGSCYNIPEAEGDRNYKDCYMYGGSVERWLNKPVTPILTEDERVILRSLDQKCYQTISREWEDLVLRGHYETVAEKVDTISDFDVYKHLFKFIKERRRI